MNKVITAICIMLTAMALALLISTLTGCGAEAGDLSHDAPWEKCGTLMKNCGDGMGDQVVVRGATSLGQHSQGDRRAYEVFDCALEEWLEGSVGANCILWVE